MATIKEANDKLDTVLIDLERQRHALSELMAQVEEQNNTLYQLSSVLLVQEPATGAPSASPDLNKVFWDKTRRTAVRVLEAVIIAGALYWILSTACTGSL